MNKEEFTYINGKINLLYSLKEKMQTKIANGEIRTDTDKKDLYVIRNSSLQAIIQILDFCEKECNDSNNPKVSMIKEIQFDIMNIFQINDPDKVTLSAINTIMPAIKKLNHYIHDCIDVPKENNHQSISVDVTKSYGIKKTFTTIIRTISGATSKEKQQKKEKKQVDVKISDDIEHVVDDIHLLDDEVVVPEISKKDYLYRLTADWENLLTFITISEKITEANYENIFEEYEDYLLAHEQRKKFEKILGKRLTTYKSYRSRTGKKHRMGEAMIFLKDFLKPEKTNDEPTSFDIRKQELEKKAKIEKELLCKQSVYFPHIIKRLQLFKTYFTTKYFSKSVPEIREGFLQVYESMVSKFVTRLNPELLSLSDKEKSILGHKHRKLELYDGILSIISKGSDVLIERGVVQGFIFGEIDDLIDQLQNIYDEHKDS